METINLFLSEDWNLENPNPKKIAKGSTKQLEESDTMINLPLEDVTLLEEDEDYQLYQINTYDNIRVFGIDWAKNKKVNT